MALDRHLVRFEGHGTQLTAGHLRGQTGLDEPLDEQVRSRWSAWDEAWEQSDEAKKIAAKEAMTALLQRRSYLQNLVRDVDQTLGGS